MTTDQDAVLRTVLVLAHEAVRQHEIAAGAAAAASRTRSLRTHVKRPLLGTYDELVAHVHDTVREHLPVGGRVLIVGKGDDALLVPGFEMCHFPQGPDGRYAGHHPFDSSDAIERLEACIAEGAEYLVFPGSSYWWLEYYGGLTSYLLSHGWVRFQDSRCLIVQLHVQPEGAPA